MSYSDHQIVQHQLFRIRFTELNEIFAVMGFRSFVIALIGLFIPIYMYELGFTLQDIFLYQLTMFISEFLFEYLSAKVISRFGPKHAIAISIPFLVIHLWMLSTLSTLHWPLWLVAISAGGSMAFYWQAYHFDFSRSKTKNEVTKDLTKLYILLAILGAIAPFIGGTIATYYGFGVLYGIVIFLLAFVFIPLIWFKEKHVGRKFNIRKINKKYIPSAREIIAYGGSGLEASISLTVWPLFIIAIVGTTQRVGLVTSIALLLSILVTYVVGRKANNSNRHDFVKIGGITDGIIYAIIIFVDSFMQVLSLNFARSLVNSLRSAPFTSEYYLHADEGNRAEHIFIMESAIDCFRIGMFGILYLLTFVLPGTQILFAGLMFGALGSIMTSFMPRAKCELPYCSNRGIKLIPKLRVQHETN